MSATDDQIFKTQRLKIEKSPESDAPVEKPQNEAEIPVVRTKSISLDAANNDEAPDTDAPGNSAAVTVKHARDEKPAEAVKAVEVEKSVEAAKPVEVEKPVEAAKPVETVMPVEAVKPVEAAKPVEVAKPVETMKPVEAVKPVEVEEPIEPVIPAEPEKPVEAEKPQKPKPTRDKTKADAEALKVVTDPSDKFDYVVPKHSFKESQKQRRKHSAKRRSEHSGKTKSLTVQEMENAADGFIFSQSGRSRGKRGRLKRKWRRLAGWKKVIIIIIAVILALIIALGSAFLIMREIGRNRMHTFDDADIVTPTENEGIIPLDPNGQVINYKGKSYMLNKNLFSITFIGYDDTADEAETHMGDAIYTMAVDSKTGRIKILGVSRDTMADIDVYSVEGKYIDTENKQISYAYSYNNDVVSGGRNTDVSLSRLFFGLPFENYFAINMDALVTLNDAIGGVTLTSTMTFVSPVDGRTISEGETVTLHGAEADYYVRTRDKSELASNNDRMERQQQYIRAFIGSVIPAVKSDISLIGTLYNMISENSDSNMSLSDIVYIASELLPKINNLADMEYVSLQGEIVEGEFAELHAGSDQAIEAMLAVFYNPIA